MTEPSLDIAAIAAAEFEQVQVLRDPAAGLLAFIAIHDTGLGPAFGGTRRWAYPDAGAALADALRLAEHMSLKCAIHGIPGGGGKAVLVDSPQLDRAAAYRRLGQYVDAMGGRFYTGPDVGTEAGDLLVMGEVTRYVALPDERGPGELAGPTAAGVFAGIRAVVRELDFADLRGVHVAVQGLGSVGWELCRLLASAGARLSVADLSEERVRAAVVEWGATAVSCAGIHALDCDIWAPCALGGVVAPETLPDLGARAVAGSANNVLQSAACGVDLFRRGLLYAPDFVINSGALVHGAAFHLEGAPPPPARIEAIEDLLAKIFFESTVADQPPEVIAERMARERLAAGGQPYFPEGSR